MDKCDSRGPAPINLIARRARELWQTDQKEARRILMAIAGQITRDNALTSLRCILQNEQSDSPLLPDHPLGRILAEGARAQGYFVSTVNLDGVVIVHIAGYRVVIRPTRRMPHGTIVLLPRALPRTQPRYKTNEEKVYDIYLDACVIRYHDSK
ncbi:MAG: hypothetical protein AAB337_01865 [Patescibacteria group bacterium]